MDFWETSSPSLLLRQEPHLVPHAETLTNPFPNRGSVPTQNGAVSPNRDPKYR